MILNRKPALFFFSFLSLSFFFWGGEVLTAVSHHNRCLKDTAKLSVSVSQLVSQAANNLLASHAWFNQDSPDLWLFVPVSDFLCQFQHKEMHAACFCTPSGPPVHYSGLAALEGKKEEAAEMRSLESSNTTQETYSSPCDKQSSSHWCRRARLTCRGLYIYQGMSQWPATPSSPVTWRNLLG